VSRLRIIDGRIEFEGTRFAQLLPKLTPSLIDAVSKALASIDEDQSYIVSLEHRIEDLEKLIDELEAAAGAP
jgi:hypothetical protein